MRNKPWLSHLNLWAKKTNWNTTSHNIIVHLPRKSTILQPLLVLVSIALHQYSFQTVTPSPLVLKNKTCSAIKSFLCCKWITKTSPSLQLLIASHLLASLTLPPLCYFKEKNLQIINNMVGEQHDNLWICKSGRDSICIHFSFSFLTTSFFNFLENYAFHLCMLIKRCAVQKHTHTNKHTHTSWCCM